MGKIGNKSRTGMTCSPLMRTKISNSLRGNKCGIGNRSRAGQKRSIEEIEKGKATWIANNHQCSMETREKIRRSKLGNKNCLGKQNALGFKHTELEKTRMSLRRKGHLVSEETRNKIAEARKGHLVSSETREKLRQWNLTHRDILVKIGKKAWEDPSKVANMMANMLKARHQKPNKLEVQFSEFLNLYFPSEWKYVGNGDLIIGRKCPDFVNINGKKQLIELFGNYWHKNKDSNTRIKFYKQYGFDTLVLWEADIKSLPEEALVQIIKSFNIAGVR